MFLYVVLYGTNCTVFDHVEILVHMKWIIAENGPAMAGLARVIPFTLLR